MKLSKVWKSTNQSINQSINQNKPYCFLSVQRWLSNVLTRTAAFPNDSLEGSWSNVWWTSNGLFGRWNGWLWWTLCTCLEEKKIDVEKIRIWSSKSSKEKKHNNLKPTVNSSKRLSICKMQEMIQIEQLMIKKLLKSIFQRFLSVENRLLDGTIGSSSCRRKAFNRVLMLWTSCHF